jgi:hypothetical protein
MTDLDDVIEAFFAIFIVIVLGYIFYTVLSALSLGLAILFALVVVVFVVVILFRVVRGLT